MDGTKDGDFDLAMISDRESFLPGEMAMITVTNNTDQSLTFYDSALGARVSRVDDTQSISFVTSPVMVVLKPGQSHKIGFILPEPGEYVVKIRAATGLTAETRLRIAKRK